MFWIVFSFSQLIFYQVSFSLAIKFFSFLIDQGDKIHCLYEFMKSSFYYQLIFKGHSMDHFQQSLYFFYSNWTHHYSQKT